MNRNRNRCAVLRGAVVAITFLVACQRDRVGVPTSRPAGLASSAASGWEPPATASSATDESCVIWFHDCTVSSLESLQIAVRCPVVTHVMLLDMHPSDSDWRANQKTRAAIRAVKHSPARLVWCRDLTPYYQLNGFRTEDMYNPQFYIEAIRNVRSEARTIGADATALDTEPYGNSPFKELAKGKRLPSADLMERLSIAVQKAVEREGQVDFILPAGSLTRGHPYQVLARLGRRRIAESTYTGRTETFASIPYDYEITGLYLHLADRDEGKHYRQYTPVVEVFQRPELWAGKAGLLLLPKRPADVQVARELAACHDRFGLTRPTRPATSQVAPRPD